jgi:tRNA threonylcarbamoyladenosine biosynthesis protein TsaE
LSRTVVLELADAAATRALGERFGRVAGAGDVIALNGPLGAGKTTFVQGLAAALGITGPVPSPTFVLCREYQGRLLLAHLDAYRLAGSDDACGAGLDEHLPGQGVTAVEWADRIVDLLPDDAVTITLSTVPGGRRAELVGVDLERWLGVEETGR